jgi:hypothetical protein
MRFSSFLVRKSFAERFAGTISLKSCRLVGDSWVLWSQGKFSIFAKSGYGFLAYLLVKTTWLTALGKSPASDISPATAYTGGLATNRKWVTN